MTRGAAAVVLLVYGAAIAFVVWLVVKAMQP